MVEQFPKMEGRQMVMVLAPKKKSSLHRSGASDCGTVSSRQVRNKWFRVFKCSCREPPGVMQIKELHHA